MNDDVQRVAEYFNGEHWRRVLDVLEERDGPITHAHAYIDTCIHPMSLDEVIGRYFAKHGKPLHRRTEIFTSGQHSDKGSIHGIEPKGQPHFDLLFGYTDEVAIRPSKGTDLESWSEAFMDDFYAQYPFREPTAQDLQSIDDYFASETWERFYDIVEDHRTVHAHANVETGIHPRHIAKVALDRMAARGWNIDKVVPVAFKMRGLWHGKLVFLGNSPEKVFDIAWMFNPVVGLVPSSRYWLLTETPQYDVRTMDEVPLLLKSNDYRMLSTSDIEAIIDAI